jgi:hypothetical protein
MRAEVRPGRSCVSVGRYLGRTSATWWQVSEDRTEQAMARGEGTSKLQMELILPSLALPNEPEV